MIGGSSVGICSYIFEEFADNNCSIFSFVILFGTNFNGGDEEFFIGSASVVEDISYDSLRAFYSRFFKGCTCSEFIEVLDPGDVRNFGVHMGQDLRILGGGWLYLVRTLVM